MEAKLNTEVEIAKHERLIKVLEMIRKCDEHIVRESRHIHTSENQGMWTKWLFENKAAWMERLRFKIAVRNRLSAYYAKQVFAMASNAYNTVTIEMKPQTTVDELMQPFQTICEDYKQSHQFSKQ